MMLEPDDSAGWTAKPKEYDLNPPQYLNQLEGWNTYHEHTARRTEKGNLPNLKLSRDHELRGDGQDVVSAGSAWNWSQFLTEVSVGGVKYVVNSSHIIRRGIWSILVLLGIGFMLYQITERIQYYQTLPTSANIEINVKDQLDFPTVTFCNENLADKELQEQEDSSYVSVLTDMYPAFKLLNRRPNFTLIQDEIDANANNKTYWKVKLDRISPINRTFSFMQFCTLQQETCNYSDWEIVQTGMGQCAQFNGENSAPSHVSRQAGWEGGLIVVMNSAQLSYSGVNSHGGGFRVLLHNRGEFARNSELGTFISAGNVVSLAMTYNSIDMLSQPYSDCEEDSSYHQVNCVLACKTAFLLRTCGCILNYMHSVEAKYCDPAETWNCAKPNLVLFNEYANARVDCNCPVTCHQKRFSHSISSQRISEVTLDAMTQHYAAAYFANDCNNASLDCSVESLRQYISYNFVQVNIFFSTFMTEETVVTPAYDVLALLCDVGGALGLILGSTILTIFEFLDFFTVAAMQAFLAKFNKNKVETS